MGLNLAGLNARLPGWRAFRLFWAGIAAALLAGAATLQVLGPPPDLVPPVVEAPAAPGPSPADTAAPTAEAPVAGLPATGAPPAAEVPPATATAEAPAAPPAPVPPPTSPAPVAAPTVTPVPPSAPVSAPPDPAPPPVAPAPPPLAAPPAGRVAAEPAGPIPRPDPALLEDSRHGPLPRVGPDGRTPIRAYSRAFPRDDTRPRIGLVVGGIGLSGALSEEAIRRLPPAVALAVSPYAARTEPLAERARARGMELLIALPLEPTGYPLNDPGPRALLTTLSVPENADNLLWVLTRLQGYVGAVGALGQMRGERFAQMPGMLGQLQEVLRDRGLLYVDPRPNPPAGTPSRAFGRTADVVVDDPATRGEIERRLAELERLARERGSALGVAGDASPVLVERVAAWAAGLEERGAVLAPVTALIRRPEPRPEARGEARGGARPETTAR